MQATLFPELADELAPPAAVPLLRHRAQDQADEAHRHRRYVERLQRVLGNGAEWEYRGGCADDPSRRGRCACGQHGLRYLFTIHHPDGRSAILGSSCIETYPGIGAGLVARVQADAARLEAEADDRRRQAEQLAQAQAAQALLARWSAAAYQLDEILAARPMRRARYTVWQNWYGARYRDAARRHVDEHQAGQLHPACRMKQYKRLADALRWLTARCQETEQWAADPFERTY